MTNSLNPEDKPVKQVDTEILAQRDLLTCVSVTDLGLNLFSDLIILIKGEPFQFITVIVFLGGVLIHSINILVLTMCQA